MTGGVLGLSNPLIAFRNFIDDPQAQLRDFSQNDQIQKKIEYFEKNISKIETIDDLFNNRRLSEFILSAFSLESEINNGIGRIKAVLKADFSDPTSLPNVLADPKFRDMAGTLRLDRDGLSAFDDANLIETLKERFIRNEFEVQAGTQDTALRQALFFSRNITSANTVFDILGDNVLRTVVQGALQIPQELAIQPVNTQAKAIESRVDIDKLISLSNELDLNESQISRARSDARILENNLQASDAALNQINGLSDQLGLILNAYADLENITDPGGLYADDITIQETAVPELLRYELMLNAGENGAENIGFLLGELVNIISAAGETGADLITLKASFSGLVGNINDAIAESETQNPFGGFDNILDNGSNDTISVEIDAAGTETAINRFDLTQLQTYLSDADTLFNTVTNESDPNLNSALGKILLSQDRIEDVQNTLSSDRESFNNAIASVEAFAATLNTNALILGKESASDALDRISTIESLLDEIKTLADESKNRLPSADRSDLEIRFNDLKSQLRAQIENTNEPGLANFLNNIRDQSYEISGGAKAVVRGGIDLLSSIADVLDTQDITTRDGATALSSQAILLEIETDKARNSLEKDIVPLNNVLNRYDPRGTIDNALYAIEDMIESFIADASANGINLLSDEQNDIILNISSSLESIRFNAFNNFENDFTNSIANAIGFLQTDLNQTQNELQDLKDLVDSIGRSLSTDANRANIELAKNGAVIDAADAQAESLEDNPYQINDFTKKFIERFLILNGGQGGTQANNPNNFLVNLVQPLSVNGTNNQNNPFASIFNLLV